MTPAGVCPPFIQKCVSPGSSSEPHRGQGGTLGRGGVGQRHADTEGSSSRQTDKQRDRQGWAGGRSGRPGLLDHPPKHQHSEGGVAREAL